MNPVKINIYKTDSFSKVAGLWERNGLKLKMLKSKMKDFWILDYLTELQRKDLMESIYHYDQSTDMPQDKFGPVSEEDCIQLPY